MSIEAMKLALEALEWNYNTDLDNISACEQWAKMLKKTIPALRQAIEQAEHAQPVGEVLNERGEVDWISFVPPAGTPLYTTPPPRQPWVGLTDEEIWKFWWSRPEVPDGEDDSMEAEFVAAVRRILAAHGITKE